MLKIMFYDVCSGRVLQRVNKCSASSGGHVVRREGEGGEHATPARVHAQVLPVDPRQARRQVCTATTQLFTVETFHALQGHSTLKTQRN